MSNEYLESLYKRAGIPYKPEEYKPNPPKDVIPTIPDSEEYVPPGTERANSYLERVLTEELDRLSKAIEGERNDILFKVAARLGDFTGGNYLLEEAAHQYIEEAATLCGLGQDEILKTLRSGIEKGKSNGYALILPQRADIPEATVLDVGHKFWDARPELRHIHDFALSKRVSPWAMLGVVMVRLLATVDPEIVLPDLVGDVASLNLFVGLVGPSGSGKSSAIKAAANAVILSPLQDDDEFKVVTLGSGQGISHAFGYNIKGEVRFYEQRSVIFKLDEIDHLKATTQQSASTILPELRCLYMGESLGAQYVEVAKRVMIPEHSYRAGFICGIQPSKAEFLLRDTDGGTPQRFLWLPANYPHPEKKPDPVDPWKWNRPDGIGSSVKWAIDVCEQAKEEVDRAQYLTARGEGNPLDGHSLLTRLKVATALAFLNSHSNVTDEDWRLSSMVMQVSDAYRQKCIDAIAGKSRIANKARAEAEAERALHVEAKVASDKMQRVMKLVLRHLEKGPMTRRILYNKMSSSVKEYFDDAIERLLEDGLVVSDQVSKSGNSAVEYRKA